MKEETDEKWWNKAKPLIDEQILEGYEQFSKEFNIIGMDLLKAKCIAHELYVIDYMFENGWELISVTETSFSPKCMYFKRFKK